MYCLQKTFFFALSFLILTVGLYVIVQQVSLVVAFGQIDFSEYWSALQLLHQSINPYLPEQMADFQSNKFARDEPIMMWNPPWLLLFMYPVLPFEFNQASQLWIGAQVLLLLVSACLVSSVLGGQRGISPGIYVALLIMSFLFMPFHNSLYFGQIGTLLLFGISLLYAGLSKKRSWMIIVGTLIITVKPHIFFLLGVVVLWWLFKEKMWRTVLFGFCFGGVLILATELIFPQSVKWWLGTLSPEQNDIVPTTHNWVGPTFGGALRAYLGSAFFQFNFLLAPFLAIGLIWYLIKERPEIRWSISFAPILAASVYLAPFGWFFDQTVLLVMYLSTVYFSLLSKNWPVVLSVILLQVFAYLYISNVARFQHEMFWYLPVLMFLWFLGYRRYVCD